MLGLLGPGKAPRRHWGSAMQSKMDNREPMACSTAHAPMGRIRWLDKANPGLLPIWNAGRAGFWECPSLSFRRWHGSPWPTPRRQRFAARAPHNQKAAESSYLPLSPMRHHFTLRSAEDQAPGGKPMIRHRNGAHSSSIGHRAIWPAQCREKHRSHRRIQWHINIKRTPYSF